MSATVPMLLTMVCATSCAWLDRCRTGAGLACSVVMLIAMLDASFLHLLPLSVCVALIVGSGVWAAFGNMHVTALSIRAFQGASAFVMAALAFHHSETMGLLDEICTSNSTLLVEQMRPDAFTSMGAITVGVAGVMLTAARLIKADRTHGVRQKVALLEPAFTGASLVLMLL